jgi:glutamate-1-semialdehyde 2,1-aminomutase
MTLAATEPKMSFAKSIAHQQRAHALIPGGAHTYAKGDDQYPENMCPVIARGRGSHVWDLDGNEFIEYGAGVRSVTLGHGYKPVVDAALAAMQDGTNFARPSAIELAAAEKMLGMIPTAEMVKFGKNGSDAVSGALKIARSITGREMVMVCGDHPFFSVDDWFIGVTAMNSGIPDWATKQTVKFKYNDLASAQALFDKYPNQIACIITEAETGEAPKPNFLHDLQELTHKNGAIFVLDETITGYRWDNRGAQGMYGLTPDLSTFGKGMANGFSVSALLGKRQYMELAGITQKERERCFVLSLTHGAETHGLAACIATIDAYHAIDPIATMVQQGGKLRDGLKQMIAVKGLTDFLPITGRPQLLMFGTIDNKGERSQPFRTLFLQELLKRGIIAPSFVVSAAHSDIDIEKTIDAVAGAADVYKKALNDGVDKYLVGRPVQPVFRKFN